MLLRLTAGLLPLRGSLGGMGRFQSTLNVIYELRFVVVLLLSRELIQPGRRPFGLVRRARARALLFTWPSNEFDERSSPCGEKRRRSAIR